VTRKRVFQAVRLGAVIVASIPFETAPTNGAPQGERSVG
jgi:hypothetical protein